jgi:hypothetical protein
VAAIAERLTRPLCAGTKRHGSFVGIASGTRSIEGVRTDAQWERIAPLMPSSDGVKSRAIP